MTRSRIGVPAWTSALVTISLSARAAASTDSSDASPGRASRRSLRASPALLGSAGSIWSTATWVPMSKPILARETGLWEGSGS